MIRAAQPLGACPGGRAPRQNWGKFEAHKWGGFTGRLEASLARIGKFILNGYSVRVEVGTCSQFGKMLACQAR